MSWPVIVRWCVHALGAYAALGLIFAVAFVARGIERVDAGARGTGWGFRLIVLPGVVAFWPLLLVRWLRGSGAPVESNAHRRLTNPGERAGG